MIERGPEWIVEAPMRTEARRTIAVPRDILWEIIADHAGWPSWFPALREVDVTGEPAGVGGRRQVTIPGMRFDEVFTAWRPGELFAFTVVATRPPLLTSMAESVTLTEAGEGRTTVVYRQGFEPRRGFGWFWGRNRARMQASLEAGLNGLAVVASARARTT